MKYKYYKLSIKMANSCCGKRSVGYSCLHKQKCQLEMLTGVSIVQCIADVPWQCRLINIILESY